MPPRYQLPGNNPASMTLKRLRKWELSNAAEGEGPCKAASVPSSPYQRGGDLEG